MPRSLKQSSLFLLFTVFTFSSSALQAQEVNFGSSSPPPQTAAPKSSSPAADSNAPPEKGYSRYAPAPGVWQENEDIPPEGIDAPPASVPPASGNPNSDTATPVGNESQAPTQGVPDPNADPNADNGGLMSAASQPAAVSGVGSDHPGMN